MDMGELALLFTWGVWSQCPNWSTKLLLRHMSRVLSWHFSTSTSSITWWNAWRDWYRRTIAWGFPRLWKTRGYLRGNSVYQKSEVLDLTNITLCNEYFQVKLFGRKGTLQDTQHLPTLSRWMKRQWRGGKDRGAKWFICLAFWCCLFLLLF